MKVGIAGVTCGGKTRLTALLKQLLSNANVSTDTICQDDYFRAKEAVRTVGKIGDLSTTFYDYDYPGAVDEQKFANELVRQSEDVDVLLVDGNMITELHDIYKQLDKVLFLTMADKQMAGGGGGSSSNSEFRKGLNECGWKNILDNGRGKMQ